MPKVRSASVTHSAGSAGSAGGSAGSGGGGRKQRRAATVVARFWQAHASMTKPKDPAELLECLAKVRDMCDEHGLKRLSIPKLAAAVQLNVATLTNGRGTVKPGGQPQSIDWSIHGLFTHGDKYAGIGAVNATHMTFVLPAFRRELECSVCLAPLGPIKDKERSKFACHAKHFCADCERRVYHCPLCRSPPKAMTVLVV